MTLRNLRDACVAALRGPHELSYFAGLKGVEVLLCTLGQDGRSDRILRVSVLADSIDSANSFEEYDLRGDNPAEGVTCGWYWDPSAVE